MRIYHDFNEALSEIKRDLAEMGVKIHTKTYQDKYIGDDPEMATLEIQNYIYTVVRPYYDRDLRPTQPWAEVEFGERVALEPKNPGEAWKLRENIWKEFLQEDGKFAYTYGDRLSHQVNEIVQTLYADPASRQAYMAVWRPTDILKTGGISRVPCSLGYHFQIRKDQLNITYLQRSADFATHFINDIYLAGKMHLHVFQQLIAAGDALDESLTLGNFTHWVGSLHVFQKDVKGVF